MAKKEVTNEALAQVLVEGLEQIEESISWIGENIEMGSADMGSLDRRVGRIAEMQMSDMLKRIQKLEDAKDA